MRASGSPIFFYHVLTSQKGDGKLNVGFLFEPRMHFFEEVSYLRMADEMEDGDIPNRERQYLRQRHLNRQ
jgi:hypothetical protein